MLRTARSHRTSSADRMSSRRPAHDLYVGQTAPAKQMNRVGCSPASAERVLRASGYAGQIPERHPIAERRMQAEFPAAGARAGHERHRRSASAPRHRLSHMRSSVRRLLIRESTPMSCRHASSSASPTPISGPSDDFAPRFAFSAAQARPTQPTTRIRPMRASLPIRGSGFESVAT